MVRLPAAGRRQDNMDKSEEKRIVINSQSTQRIQIPFTAIGNKCYFPGKADQWETT